MMIDPSDPLLSVPSKDQEVKRRTSTSKSRERSPQRNPLIPKGQKTLKMENSSVEDVVELLQEVIDKTVEESNKKRRGTKRGFIEDEVTDSEDGSGASEGDDLESTFGSCESLEEIGNKEKQCQRNDDADGSVPTRGDFCPFGYSRPSFSPLRALKTSSILTENSSSRLSSGYHSFSSSRSDVDTEASLSPPPSPPNTNLFFWEKQREEIDPIEDHHRQNR